MPFANPTSAAIFLQKRIRGYLVRKKIKVKTIAPGVIHIHIQGGYDTFNSIGIDGIDRLRAYRMVDTLSIDYKLYQSYVAGGCEVINLVQSSNRQRRQFFGCNETVFINASFFNSENYIKGAPEHATFGQAINYKGDTIPCVPLNPIYAQDYVCMSFNKGGRIACAPLLTHHGIMALDKKKSQHAAYQYSTLGGRQCPPGSLFHWSDPNPRAAISIPDKHAVNVYPKSKQDRIRIAISRANSRGPLSNGFTMLEWAHVMSRLSNMNQRQGHALNLDGGQSVTMGLMNEKGENTFLVSQNEEGRANSTFLAFKKK